MIRNRVVDFVGALASVDALLALKFLIEEKEKFFYAGWLAFSIVVTAVAIVDIILRD